MISIILPTYNEAGNIALLINKIILALKGYRLEIIVVDDDSPDKTWQIASRLAKKNPQIRLFRRFHTRGLTSAFNLGIAESRGSIVGWLDADLSHPPELLGKMILSLSQFDVVTLSRYLPGSGDKRQNNLAVYLSYIVNFFARVCLGKSLTDYTSGCILAKKKLFDNFSLTGDYGEYFIDMIVRFRRLGYKIKEIPYNCLPRLKGESKTASNLLGFLKRGLKYIFTIIKLIPLRFK